MFVPLQCRHDASDNSQRHLRDQEGKRQPVGSNCNQRKKRKMDRILNW
jgi:hypothetical protein